MEPVEHEVNKFEPFLGVINQVVFKTLFQYLNNNSSKDFKNRIIIMFHNFQYGVSYKTKYAATDLGSMLLNQMIETRLRGSEKPLTRDEAISVLKDAMKV